MSDILADVYCINLTFLETQNYKFLAIIGYYKHLKDHQNRIGIRTIYNQYIVFMMSKMF